MRKIVKEIVPRYHVSYFNDTKYTHCMYNRRCIKLIYIEDLDRRRIQFHFFLTQCEKIV